MIISSRLFPSNDNPSNIIIVLLLFFFQILSSLSQQISLESSILSCHNEEGAESFLLKNPIRLAKTTHSQDEQFGPSSINTYSSCRKMLIITLRILEYSQDFVSDGLVIIDHGMNTFTHKSTKFRSPIAIKFHQENILLRYPLKYLYKVNGKMWEEVYNNENLSNYTGCSDSDEKGTFPTCGFSGGEQNSLQKAKQVAGFCCPCKEGLTLQQRGGQRCDVHGMDKKLLTSAHCLRSGPFIYSAYEVGLPMLYQKISIEVFKSDELLNGTIHWKKLSKSEDGIVVDSLHPVNASGTFKVTYRPHLESLDEDSSILHRPDFHPRLLYPNPNPHISPNATPEAFKGPIQNQILIVPKSLMSPKGAKCDHVGTGTEAFLSQEDPCQKERGSCLKNQPLDLWKMDEGPHGNENKKFRLSSFAPTISFDSDSSLAPPIVELSKDLKSGSLFIQHKSPLPTYLDVEVSADDLHLVSPGYNAIIESVLTDTGTEGAKVIVQVLNAEYVGATFTVMLEQCNFDSAGSKNDPRFNSTSTPKTIAPLGASNFYIDLYPYQIPQPVYCFVVVANQFEEKVAAREILLVPGETCLCVHTCKCACGDGENVKCEPLSDDNIIAAGFFDKKIFEQTEHERFWKAIYWTILIILIIIWCLVCFCVFCKRKKRGQCRYCLVSNPMISDNGNEDKGNVYIVEEIEEKQDKPSFATLNDIEATSSSLPTLIEKVGSNHQEISESNTTQLNKAGSEEDDSLSLPSPPHYSLEESSIELSDDDEDSSSKVSNNNPLEKNQYYFRNQQINKEPMYDDDYYDKNNNAYILQLMSVSSSKTSFGNWNRRKREQFTAYDFLPFRLVEDNLFKNSYIIRYAYKKLSPQSIQPFEDFG